MILLTARPDAIGACLPRPKMAARTNAAYGRVVNFESIRAEVGAAPAISLAKMGTGGRNATRGYNVLAARVPLDAPVALIRLVTGTIVMGRSRFADLCRPLPVDGKTAGYFVKNDRGAR
jgi:hypothetical protein